MIEIFLSENYNKDLLKSELEWIKETASRDLTYNVSRSKGLDVYINPYRFTKDEVKEISSYIEFKDDVCVFIDEAWIYEYLNGEKLGISSMEEYVKGM
ncbi:hypothetical protein [Staphylococcus phage LSA2302]|nr:hypothetical protein [Staphylococcus phage LSA2302]